MAMLRRVALRHGLQALLHEKPFAGINGSGKHCNWSMSITSDNDARRPQPAQAGHDAAPEHPLPRLPRRGAARAVHKHAGLLRAGIATSGNEHRLGANEAPPAIISVFMGDDAHAASSRTSPTGKAAEPSAEQELIKLGVAKLPEIEKDNTDRNRTSPFAFTGNKFEFRAVGSVAVDRLPDHAAQRRRRRSDRRDHRPRSRAELKKTKKVDDAVLKVVRKVFKETTPVRFEGNNYSERG